MAGEGGRGWRLDFDEQALQELLEGPDGPVARMLERAAEAVTQAAKGLAPVSADGSNGRPSGYGRSQIGWELGKDAEGLYADIASPAETPDGTKYMLLQEIGTRYMDAQPHLRPALDAVPGAI